MSLNSLSHAKITDLTMGRHKKTKKIGGRRLNDETKRRAIFLKKEGKLSNRQIAACCKVSPSTVTNLWEKYETGSMNERNDRRTIAPRKTTPRQDRALVCASERDRFKTAPQHRRDLITEGTCLSTIKRRLKEGNLNGRVARKKPLISEVNCQTQGRKYHGLGLCEWCWYGQTKRVGRKSRCRSLLSHITSSNGAHYETPR